MTNIERLRISGFKSIDQIELEPAQINLITGRNNVGKTSLLESIDLVFNPGNIERFRQNLDKVINEDNSAASIECEYSKEQRTLETYDIASDSSLIHKEIGLTRPTDQQIVEYSMKTIERILDINEEYPMRFGGEFNNLQSVQKLENIRSKIDEIMTETVMNISEKTLISRMEKSIIILEIDGEIYPYIHLGNGYSELRMNVVNQCVNKSINLLKKDNITIEDEGEIKKRLSRDFRSLLAPRFGGDQFVMEEPRHIEGVSLIISPKLESNDISMDEDRSAIRVSDIEDFLIESDIVENLNDFSFDKVVYTKDGSKHEVPYDFMGAGLKNIVGCLWHLYDNQNNGNVLLLEEPDVHMHPGYIETLIRQLIKMVKVEDIQLFITTHNSDTIEGFLSSPLEQSQGDFLKENFQIIQMTEKIHRELDYKQAQKEVHDINSDLRGI